MRMENFVISQAEHAFRVILENEVVSQIKDNRITVAIEKKIDVRALI